MQRFPPKIVCGSWICRVLLAVMWLAVITARQAVAAATAPAVTNLSQLSAVSEALIQEGFEFQIEGVVNHVDRPWRLLWISDQGVPRFIYLPENSPEMSVGRRIRVVGRTAPGTRDFHPDSLRFEDLGPGQIPEPIAMSMSAPDSDAFHQRRVVMEGLVRSVDMLDVTHARLSVVQDGNDFEFLLKVRTGELADGFVNARIRSTGVYSLEVNPTTRRTLRKLWIEAVAQVEVLDQLDAASKFIQPLVALGDLLQRQRDPVVRVAVVVDRNEPGKPIEVHDATGRGRLTTWQATRFQPGEVIQAYGRPVVEGLEFGLKDAVIRRWEGPRPETLSGSGTLRQAAQIRGLPASEAAAHRPVQLWGVVTWYRGVDRALILNDSTAGIYVSLGTNRTEIPVGQLIELEGVTDTGAFAPVVLARTWRLGGPAPFPEPLRVSTEVAMSGAYDSQWIELSGVVRSVDQEWGLGRLTVMDGAASFMVRLPDRPDLKALEGSLIRVRGAVTTRLSAQQRIQGISVWPPPEPIRIEAAAWKDPMAAPLVALTNLTVVSTFQAANVWTRVQATVTYSQAGTFTTVQSGDEAMVVFFRKPTAFQPGERIEVIGLPRFERMRRVLREAEVLRRETGAQLEPSRPTAEQLLTPDYEARLVEIGGNVIQTPGFSGAPRWLLQSGALVFEAEADGPSVTGSWPRFELGSWVTARGVCRFQLDERGQLGSLRLHLRGPEDFVLKSGPEWLNRRRATQILLLLAVAVAAILGWVFTLRTRVQQQTTEIAERFEAETALQNRYRELVDNATDMMVTQDLARSVLLANPAALRMLGRSAKEVLGHRFSEFVARECHPVLEVALEAKLAGKAAPPYEITLVRPDGSRVFVEINSRLVREDERAVRIESIGRDVTQRRKLEDRLRQSQRMESVGRLAAGVAHDFNNLLTVILGNSNLALTSETLNEGDRESISAVAESAERAAALTRQLLTFSRQQPMNRQRLDLNQAVQDLMRLLKKVVGDHAELLWEPHTATRDVLADRTMIEQAVMNLVVNARDAVPRDGKISLSLKRCWVDATWVNTHPGVRAGEYTGIVVRDTGHGMDAATKARVFEPFFSTKEVGKGTGLGLAIVHGVAQQHGGWVDLESTVGVGTTFTLWFPSLDATAGEPKTSVVAEPPSLASASKAAPSEPAPAVSARG
jgi:PAS domain S-box-containing protein